MPVLCSPSMKSTSTDSHVFAAAMTAHRVDNLHPGRYMNLFILLIDARIVVWFTAAALSIVWYPGLPE